MKPVNVEILLRGNLNKGLSDAKTQADLLDASLKRVAVTVGGMFTVTQAAQFVKTLIEVRGEIQRIQFDMESLVGNSGKARDMFAEMFDYTLKLPITLSDMAKGAQTMLAFNVSAEKVIPALKQIADITGGNSERFKALALAYAQMSTMGRLVGQDLLQMVNAGFNPLVIIAEKTGKSMAQLKEEMEDGAISSQMVADAFTAATAEGGKFHNRLKNVSEGIDGLKTKLEGAIEKMFNDFGEKNDGLITDSIKGATFLVQNYEAVGKALFSLITVYGAYKAALVATIALERIRNFSDSIRLVLMFRKELGLLTAAQQAFNITAAANPYVALTMALVALAAVVWTYTKANSAAADELERVNEREREQTEAIEKKREAVEESIRVLEDEVSTEGERQQAFEDLKKLMPSVFEQYETEADLLRNITAARRESNAEIEREKQLKVEQNYQDDKKRIEELRRLRALLSIDTKDIKSAEYWETKELYGKYAADIRKSRGTFEKNLDAVTSMIPAAVRAANSKAEQARVDAHNAYIARVSTMGKSDLQKQVAHLKGVLRQLGNSGLWTHLQGEVAPVNAAEIKARMSTVTARLSTIQNDSARDYKTDALKAWKAAQKEVAAVIAGRNNKDLYPTEGEYRSKLRAAREKEQKAKKDYESLGGTTTQKKKGATGLSAAEKNNIKNAEHEDTLRRVEKQKAEQMAVEKKADFDLRAAAIAREKEGAEKQRMQVALDYDRAIEENRLRRLRWIEELQQLSDAEFEAAHPDWKKQGKKRPTITEKDLSPVQRTQLKAYEAAANADRDNATAAIYKPLLEEYRTYEQQRSAIREKFAKDRAELERAVDEKGNKLSADDLAARLAEVDKKEKEALRQISDAQINELSKNNRFLVDLFEDSSRKSITEIEAIIAKIRLLLAYLKAAKNENGDAVIAGENGKPARTIKASEVVALGFTPEQLLALSESPEKLKALGDALRGLQDDLDSRNSFDAFIRKIEEGFERLKKGDWKGGVAAISGAVSSFTPQLQEAAGALSQIFDGGNEKGGGLADELNTAIAALDNFAKLAEGIATGNPLAVLQGLGGLFSMANAAAARHRAALAAIMKEKIEQQREYNLLLMEQNLEYERGTTIFGADDYGKANNAVRVMKQAVAELNKELAGTSAQQAAFAKKNTGIAWLDQVLNKNYSARKELYAGVADLWVKTGHKKTGLFGWGKGKDTYSSLLDVYPEIISANGEFNLSLAKTILSTRELKGDGKEALQYMIDLAEQSEKAWEEVRNYFSDIFGDLGVTISDALRNAFRSGTDAAKEFTASVEEMLANLAEQMAYSVTISPLLERAQEQMLSTMRNDGLTDEQKFNAYADILAAMTDDVMGQQEKFNSLLSRFDAIARDKGIDLSNATSTTQKGQSTALQSVTQDSVTRVEGLVNALLLHTISTEQSVESAAQQLAGVLQSLKKIENNTADSAETLHTLQALTETIKNDLSVLRRDGIKTL